MYPPELNGYSIGKGKPKESLHYCMSQQSGNTTQINKQTEK